MSTRIPTETYTHLLSPEYWGFINQVEASFPIDFSSLPIEKQREAYNAMLADLASGDPKNVTTQDSELKTAKHSLPIRTYQANGIKPAAHISCIFMAVVLFWVAWIVITGFALIFAQVQVLSSLRWIIV